MEPIYQFQGKHRFLSNFWIEPDGTCVELEYQRAKCSEPEETTKFDNKTPGQAKRLGRSVKLRPDWEETKITLMYILVTQKFLDHEELRNQLLETGDATLIEGNQWGDHFWGKVDNGRGVGENHLGRILMNVRKMLKQKPLGAGGPAPSTSRQH